MSYEAHLNEFRGFSRVRKLPLILCILVTLGGGPVAAEELDSGEIRRLVNEMVAEHGFSADSLSAVLNQAKYLGRVVKAMSRPAEKA